MTLLTVDEAAERLATKPKALHRNPCRIPGAGQARSQERPLLDLDQVADLITQMPERLQLPCVLIFWAQLRLGELLGLERMDVDATAATLRVDRQVVEVDGIGPIVTEPKAASRRLIHLPAQAIEPLRDHLRATGPALPNARLFVRTDGSEMRAHDLQNAWSVARERARLPGVHIHDLRHAGLTLTAQAGATLAEVMRRAGHATSRAAMIYQHAAEQRDQEIANRLSQLGSTGTIPVRRGTRGARGSTTTT